MLIHLSTDNTWNIYADMDRAKAENTVEDPIMFKNQTHIININDSAIIDGKT